MIGMKKVRFTKSPTGAFNLGYHVGDVAELEPKQAAELIEAGYAVEEDAPADDTGNDTTQTGNVPFEEMKVDELRTQAKEKGINPNGLNKGQLIAALRAAADTDPAE